ncbi:LysM peptidoglycan-binding domain-containing protein [Candidatus Formimonas warabiya]|uniref:LysM peptidoglycan-binding domain-containing protein n=1 Tax=Formimonas warabiya TaxID=1761012 RepID=UPI0011D0DBDB|nr:LysM peptidoglycan-binding domain-containing protein [Candidatus Formimonas warabiya]
MYRNCLYCMYYYPCCSMPMMMNQFRSGSFPGMAHQRGDMRQRPCRGFMYQVKRGDTLYSIAQHYKISLNSLIGANPQITDPNVLSIGQTICVPGVMPLPTPVECTGEIYSVRSGDKLTAIARRFNVTVSAILAANPSISNPDNLMVGFNLCIPHACSGRIYTVRQGDTLSGIAQRFGVPYRSLIQANPQIIDPNQLFIGQNICIPSVSPVVYRNTQYGFSFSLPESWRGYRIVTDRWEGLDINGQVVETGPEIMIRHPLWTAERPRQDIPIMIFTLDQWRSLEQDKFHIGAAPIGPRELGRNKRYVMALPARYNFAFPEGYEEVERILEGNPLHTDENI